MEPRRVFLEGPPRAKHLPLGSGVYRVSHAPQGAPANDDAPRLNEVPEQRSARRGAMSRALAALLADALRADGLSDADAGAACDRAKRHVVDMRSPDGRSITLADGVLIARVSPSFRAALVDLLSGGGR